MNRYVFMKLRPSNKDDFSDQWGRKRIGAMYFEQSATGAIQRKPCYFTEETDLVAFRELYIKNQIFVLIQPFDEVEVIEEKEEITTN